MEAELASTALTKKEQHPSRFRAAIAVSGRGARGDGGKGARRGEGLGAGLGEGLGAGSLLGGGLGMGFAGADFGEDFLGEGILPPLLGCFFRASPMPSSKLADKKTMKAGNLSNMVDDVDVASGLVLWGEACPD